MMDHERTEKELEEIFGEIQHSYKTFIDDALALQEDTRVLPAGCSRAWGQEEEEEAEGLRATWEELADKSRVSVIDSRGWRGSPAKPT